MRNFLAAVLSVIAVGVLLIAYGLLAPRAIAAPGDNGGIVTLDSNRAPALSERALLRESNGYANERVPYVPQPRRVVPSERRIMRESRDWKKTALVIGGSTAAGAGIGGAFGGKTGALVGAAIGGGASSLFEAIHR